MFAIKLLQPAPSTSLMHASIGDSTGIRFPSTASLSCFHAALEGQSASAGRLRRKVLLANSERGQSGSNAVRPDLFKNVLRSTWFVPPCEFSRHRVFSTTRPRYM